MRIVADANVFAHNDWMIPLVKAARDGQIMLFWSPALIAEASRVLLWIWLHKRGGAMTEALKRESFDIARRWLQRMSSVFHVVEDRPPHEPLWTDSPRDEDDRPLWNAASRAEADIILTENLKDGPPADSSGIQTWNGVMYVHPESLVSVLDWYGHGMETGQSPDFEEDVRLSGPLRDLLLSLERRAQAELPPSDE